MNKLHLCMNCLDSGAVSYPVGFDRGNQRDPVRPVLELCHSCIAWLEDGDFVALRESSRDERVVKAHDNG